MKTPEQWLEKFEFGSREGRTDFQVIDAEDVVAIQRDAYRQGLVDAAKAMCPGCKKVMGCCADSSNCPGDNLPGVPLCFAGELWKRIAAFDKEQPNG